MHKQISGQNYTQEEEKRVKKSALLNWTVTSLFFYCCENMYM